MRSAPAVGIRTKVTSSVLALTSVIALAVATGPASADGLTAEQLAMIKKYGITEADQRKLFGTTVAENKPRATLPKTPAATASVVPASDVIPAEVAAAEAVEETGFFAGTTVFGGFDTFKSLGDRITNINGGTGALTGSYGAVIGFNSGHTLTESGFGIQVGAALGFYDPKGRLRIIPEATALETHQYYTVGVYKHANPSDEGGSFADRLSLGLVVDAMHAENWGVNANNISLSQLRGTVGYALNTRTEVGVWATHGLDTDDAAVTVAGAPGVRREIRAADQANLYVKHHFGFGGDITGYLGVFDGSAIGEWQVGMTAKVPLNPDWAVYSSANYVVPDSASGPNGSGEEQFSLSFGLTYHFGGNAASTGVGGSKRLPMLDVANTRTFLITDSLTHP